jgi:hypothetical protein
MKAHNGLFAHDPGTSAKRHIEEQASLSANCVKLYLVNI